MPYPAQARTLDQISASTFDSVKPAEPMTSSRAVVPDADGAPHGRVPAAALTGASPAPPRRHTAASTPPFPLPSSSGSLHTRSRKIAAATTAAPASTDSPA